MKCPHCLVTFDDHWSEQDFVMDKMAWWSIRWTKCSACQKATIRLRAVRVGEQGEAETTVWPKGSNRPVAPEVPDVYANQFREACVVLPDSANASAALSRRCLQSLLVNEAGAKRGNLVKQIEEVVGSKQLRPQLADNLHYVRKVGNLAAHETKSDHTGEIVEATNEEAEWLIEVLEGLFEHFFVEPVREQQRRERFDARMKASKEASAVTAVEAAPAGSGQDAQT